MREEKRASKVLALSISENSRLLVRLTYFARAAA